VPAFALLLYGLYYRQRRLYTAHLLFALHLHALWYILFTLLALLDPLARPFEETDTLTILSGTAVVLTSASLPSAKPMHNSSLVVKI